MGREREGRGRVTDQRTTRGENTVFGEGQRKVGRERGGTEGLEEEGRSFRTRECSSRRHPAAGFVSTCLAPRPRISLLQTDGIGSVVRREKLSEHARCASNTSPYLPCPVGNRTEGFHGEVLGPHGVQTVSNCTETEWRPLCARRERARGVSSTASISAGALPLETDSVRSCRDSRSCCETLKYSRKLKKTIKLK